MYLKPSNICFSQDTISYTFRRNTAHSGIRIGETLDDVCNGRCLVTNIPTISVVNLNGKWVTADNRRLWVFRHLERLGKCNEILVSQECYIFPNKLTSTNGGVSIGVRGHPGGRWYLKPNATHPVVSSFSIDINVPGEPFSMNRPVPFDMLVTESQLRQVHIGNALATHYDAMGSQTPVQAYMSTRKDVLGSTHARAVLHRREEHQTVNRGKERLLVAAIDFGTTNSGYAFSFRSDFLNDPLKIITNQWNTGAGTSVAYKAPTCILFNQDGEFNSFGFEAEEKYAQLAADVNHRSWFFFKHFKMILYEKKNLNRMTQLKDDKGLTMPAMTVFTECIQCLKRHLTETCIGKHAGVREDEIHWVITVPAIWDESAKQFMREAAIDAGIRTDCLSLALEPEAASMFCHLRPALTADDDDLVAGVLSLEQGMKYLVLDAGGGTVDITVHEVLPNHKVKELYKANGGPLGGTKIDDAFLSLLTNIFGEGTIELFKENYKEDYLELLRDFEIKKGRINPGIDKIFTFKIPASIKEAYLDSKGHEFSTQSIRPDIRDQITLTMDKLRVHPKVAKDLFETTCNTIVLHLLDIFRQPALRGVNTIVMVGGFSESKMLQHAIQGSFPSKKIIIPEEAGLAVVKGAVIFGHKAEVIVSRIARFTYGVGMTRPFKLGDPVAKKRTVRGIKKCTNCFGAHVHIGQEVKIGKALTEQNYMPPSESPTKFSVKIYRSDERYPSFTDEAGCSYIGKLDIDLSDIDCYEDRNTAVKMIFGDTELGVEVRVVKTGQIVKAKFDFLG